VENNNQLLLIQIERERRRRKSGAAAPAAVEQPAEPTWGKKAAEVISGIGAGAAGGIPDLLSIPTRVVGGAVGGGAKLAEMAGAGDTATKVKDFAFGVATQPSFTEKAQNAMNSVNEGYTKPTTAEGRAVQSGAQAVGSVMSGSAIKKGAEVLARKTIDYAPKVAEAANKIAQSRFLKFASAATPAQVSGAGGAGAGAQLMTEYAGDSPVAQIAAPIAGAIGGGTIAGVAGMGVNRAINSVVRTKAPSTGVGQALIGATGSAVDPDVPFAQLTGKVRAAAANELKSVRSKYRRAEELSPRAAFNKSALGSYKNGLMARAESPDPEVTNLYTGAVRYLEDLEARKGQVGIADIARGLRRYFSEKSASGSNGTLMNAAGEGAKFTDTFLDDVIDNNRVTNAGKDAIKAWKDATTSNRNYASKFKDAQEISNIVAKDAKTNRKLLPSQVGTYFRPAAENSNVGNVWDATLNALPAGERVAGNDAIRRGIFHKSLTSSLKQTSSGLEIDDTALLNNLMTLRADKGAWSKFTPQQRASIDKLRAELVRGKRDPKRIAKATALSALAFTGRSLFGLGNAAGEAVGGIAQSKVDDLIKLLDTPVPLDKAPSGAVPRSLLPAAVQQVIPDGQQE